jgi:hypothetical protein
LRPDPGDRASLMAPTMPADARSRGGFSIERIIDIDRPQAEVFAYLADTASFAAVDRALVEYEPHGVLTEGLEGRFVHRRGGMRARTTWKVEELTAPSRLRVSLRGMGYEMESLVELGPDDGGTLARFVDSVWPTNLGGRLMVALSGGIMRRDLRARSDRLKAILGGPAAETGAARS